MATMRNEIADESNRENYKGEIMDTSNNRAADGSGPARNQARKANRFDMTSGPLASKILFFTVQVAITSILQQMYSVADTTVAGQFLGTNDMAGIGTNAPIVSLLVGLFQGISLGANVAIATAIGAKHLGRIHDSVHTAIALALVGGIVCAIAGELAAEPLLDMLSVPAEVMPFAVLYLRIYLIGLPVVFLYDFEAAILRSSGNAREPLYALIVSSVLNIVLDLTTTLVFNWGVAGITASTVLSVAVSAAILFAYLVKTDTPVKLVPRDLHFEKNAFGEIIRVGLPAGIQGALFSVANIVIQGAVNSLGPEFIAGSAAALNLEVFCYFAINAFGQACTTFVGQNNGARKPKRCKQVMHVCFGECAVWTATCIALVWVFGRSLVSFFNGDSVVIEAGYQRACYVFSAYGFSTIIEIVSGYLRAYGLSLWPAIVTLVGIVVVRLIWVATVFSSTPDFGTLMLVYPVSLGINAAGIVALYFILKRLMPGHQFGLAGGVE